MKPFAQKIGRIECPRCHSTNLNVVIKGMIRKNGQTKTAIREIEECSLCHYTEVNTLSPEQMQKVDNQTTNTMKAKDMYQIRATRTIGAEKWHWIKWLGRWEGEAMGELTREIGEACKTFESIQSDGEMTEVPVAGMHLDRSGEKAMLLIRDDRIQAFEEVIESPLFQDAFQPFARVSEDKIAALRDAFKDAE